MTVLYKNVVLRGKKGNVTVKACFDSERRESYVQRNLAEKIDELVDFNEIFSDRTTQDMHLLVTLLIDDFTFSSKFKVLNNPIEEVIIGTLMQRKNNIVLDFEHGKIDTSSCRRYDTI